MQHQHEPDILRNLRAELVDWRPWLDRAIVLAAAAAAGLLVVGFTLLTNHALALFERLWRHAPWAIFVTGPLCVAAIVWVTRRFIPGAGASGIPQVMAALDTATPTQQYGLFVSLRISLAKVLLSSAGLLAGLSIGREGPSVQVAAGVLAAVLWSLRNPRRGLCLPEDLPHEEVLRDAKPYLGETVSVRSDWTPLVQQRVYFEENEDACVDREDPWQFQNFVFRP